MGIRIARSPEAVCRAIRVFRTQELLAEHLDVAQTSVSAWGTGARPVPAEHCPMIEQGTRELARKRGDPSLIVTCEELRPDVNWRVLRRAATA